MIITQLSVNLERKSVFLVKMRNTDFLEDMSKYTGSTISGVDIEILLSIPISDFLFLN